MDWLQNLWRHTLVALQFFSRLPLPERLQNNTAHLKLNDAITAFPLAGLIIALPPALLWYIANPFLPAFVAATLAIGLGTFITGALHEDGLADSADGLGGSDRNRALEIMRDSAIGTYGASALFFSFTLRIAALASLDAGTGALALLLAHSVARAAIAIALYTADYVRKSGLGDRVRDGIPRQDFTTTIAITALLALLLVILSGQPSGLLAPLLAMAAAWAVLQGLKSRLGGYTGDGLGAMEQVAEITTLIALAALWA